jgi:hypothetical protein
MDTAAIVKMAGCSTHVGLSAFSSTDELLTRRVLERDRQNGHLGEIIRYPPPLFIAVA